MKFAGMAADVTKAKVPATQLPMASHVVPLFWEHAVPSGALLTLHIPALHATVWQLPAKTGTQSLTAAHWVRHAVGPAHVRSPGHGSLTGSKEQLPWPSHVVAREVMLPEHDVAPWQSPVG
jgi:hypothetical protein